MSTSICLTLVSSFKRRFRLQWRGEAPGASAMEEPDGSQRCDVRILVRCRPCYLVNEAGRLSDPRMAGVSCQVGMPVTMHDAHSVQLALGARLRDRFCRNRVHPCDASEIHCPPTGCGRKVPYRV